MSLVGESAVTMCDTAFASARRLKAPYWEAQAKMDAAFMLRRELPAAETNGLRYEAVTIAEKRGYERILKQADALI